MSRFEVQFLPAAIKDLKKIKKGDPRALNRIKRALEGLAVDRHPPNAKPMQGHKDTYRLRHGDYRAVYRVQGAKLIVLVIAVGDRGDIYDRLRRRLLS